MNEIRELKACLADELEESFRRGVINNMPLSPMVILYQDETALQAKNSINSVMVQIWGDRSNAVVQYSLINGKFHDIDTGEELETEAAQERIDEMYANESSFRDMSRFKVIMIQSTSTCADVSEFQRKYAEVQAIEEIIADGIFTTSVILLDESTKRRKTSESIREYLRDILQSGESPYSSTIILSNRISNGSLLAGERIKENYALIGWIILLMNGVGAGYKPNNTLFYPIDKSNYLTAAFSEVTRPNEGICNIVLHTMLSWIDRQLRSQGGASYGRMDIEDLYHRLEIREGKATFLDDFFRTNVADKLPSTDVMRFLPRVHASSLDPAAAPYAAFDQETVGACSVFLSQLALFDGKLKMEFSKFLQGYVRKRLSAAEREKVLTVANVQKMLRQLKPVSPTGRERVDEYIQLKTYSDYIHWALPICEEILGREQKLSAEHSKEFEAILEEFQQGYFPDDEDLERYYSDLTNDVLGGAEGLGERLLDDISSHSTERSALLDSLRRAVEEIFSARKVFHMPLEQEMINRMGQNPHDIHAQINSALFQDLDGRIRLKTKIALSNGKPFTIVNRRDEDGQDTELYRSLQEHVSDAALMTYFDSCNSNSIKIVQIYNVDSSGLI